MRCAVVLAILLSAEVAHAECGEDGVRGVALSATAGTVIGAGTALASSGIISAADDTRDYHFWVGAVAGIAVTTGLSGIYAIYDGLTGCGMSNESTLGIVWSVPVIMFILGSSLPIAIWGGSEEIETTPPEEPVPMMEVVRF